jgi:hypothetical protein
VCSVEDVNEMNVRVRQLRERDRDRERDGVLGRVVEREHD